MVNHNDKMPQWYSDLESFSLGLEQCRGALEALDAELQTRGAAHIVTLVRPQSAEWRTTVFLSAIGLGFVDVAAVLLTEGLIVVDAEGGMETRLGLLLAAKGGHTALVESLLARGARDVRAPPATACASLTAAIAFGHLDCATLLLATLSGPPPVEILLDAIKSRQLAFMVLEVLRGRFSIQYYYPRQLEAQRTWKRVQRRELGL